MAIKVGVMGAGRWGTNLTRTFHELGALGAIAEADAERRNREPLRLECEHFLAAIRTRRPPLPDGASGFSVLHVLEQAQRHLGSLA